MLDYFYWYLSDIQPINIAYDEAFFPEISLNILSIILSLLLLQLETQLSKLQVENTNLKLGNEHLKSLIKQETEAKIVQLLNYK